MADEFSIRFHGSTDHPYSALLDEAARRALALDSKLPEFVLDLEGMSGRKYRRLINRLVETMPDARYLEVGSWAGSTCCSAIYGNKVTATCIDNWSLFGGPKDHFVHNTNMCRSDQVAFRFIEADFRTVDYTSIGSHNIYLFDGPHEIIDQKDGVTVAQSALDNEFVLIVDDWNWGGVRQGTFEGIGAAELDILYAIEVRSSQDGTTPPVERQHSDWHNGYFLSVLRKRAPA